MLQTVSGFAEQRASRRKKKKWGARSIHRPDRVNMKACRWIGVRACACALHFRQLDVRGPAGCQRKTRETESSSTTHAYCTARVYLCVLAQRGFLGADLSEFCCVSSSVGRHEYSWGPLVFGKSLVSFPQRAPRPGRGGGGCTAEVNQCFIAGSPFLASGRAGGRSCQSWPRRGASCLS